MFTADLARTLSATLAHATELEKNENVLRSAASITDKAELAHHRKIGVLIYATNETQMEADMRKRGFTTSRVGTAGFLRAYW